MFLLSAEARLASARPHCASILEFSRASSTRSLFVHASTCRNEGEWRMKSGKRRMGNLGRVEMENV